MKTPFTADMLCYQFHLKIDDCNQIKIQKRDKTEDDNWIHRRDEVMRARQFAADNHMCVKCLKKLTAIGQDRKMENPTRTGLVVNYIKSVSRKLLIRSYK